jgi:hypothetical protein
MSANVVPWHVENEPWYSEYNYTRFSGSLIEITPDALVIQEVKEEKVLAASALVGPIGGLWTFAAMVLGFLFNQRN